MVCLLAPPAYVDSSTATRMNNPGMPGGRAALSVPRGLSNRAANPPWDATQPWAAPPVPTQSRSAGSPQSSARLRRPRQAVVGWPAACQLTWRRRVQADDSPGGLSVRHPLPPFRRPEHQTTDRPTRRSPPPPPQTQRHPSSAHTTHTGTAVSPSRVCHRGVQGLSAVRHALRPRQPGAPNTIESRRDGCADHGPGRPGEALTHTKPKPPLK